jgi:FMN phosphatase YigB (HAD superfamily)
VIRAVVFDLFDTLVDLHMERIPPIEHAGTRISGTARALHDAFSRRVQGVDFDRFAAALGAVDGDFRTSRYAKGLELPTEERFAAVLERLDAFDPSLVSDLTDVHMGALRALVRVHEHHVDVMRDLRGRVPLALCSNFSHSQTALRILEQARLAEFLDVVGISDAIGIRKPRPEIFQWVLAGLRAEPREILHVGDSLSADVAGAAALGIPTVWITRRVADPAAVLRSHEGPKPDYTIADLSELVPLVRSLAS